jgi:hypothetical protein
MRAVAFCISNSLYSLPAVLAMSGPQRYARFIGYHCSLTCLFCIKSELYITSHLGFLPDNFLPELLVQSFPTHAQCACRTSPTHLLPRRSLPHTPLKFLYHGIFDTSLAAKFSLYISTQYLCSLNRQEKQFTNHSNPTDDVCLRRNRRAFTRNHHTHRVHSPGPSTTHVA